MRLNPLNQCDVYKYGHIFQYPKGTEVVYSNLTARSARLAPVLPQYFDNKVVFLGLQGFIKEILMETWQTNFFDLPKDVVLRKYKRRVDGVLGPDAITINHIAALHDLGYLPIRISALPEGSRVNIKTPMLTIENTHPDFFWLVNYLETVLSNSLWKPSTTATIAYEYRKCLTNWAEKTGSPIEFVDVQAHDFSARGMSGPEDAARSGLGHLTSFVGTDTVSAIDYAEDYYNADAEKELIGCSVPATEHSVMCMGGNEEEIETFRRLIEDQYPTGIVSIVSDTWDFWKVITEYTVILKDKIMTRQPNAIGLNKVVFRPDSGDPVKILVGDPDAPAGTPANKGAVQCLWDIFGGTETATGHKLLDQHVGLIYGDSITLERAEAILSGLAAKGFASANVVFGVGSFTYNYLTRDTFGFAVKATYGVVNGEGRELFKDPITDSGTKKSAKGLLRVEEVDGQFVLYDQQSEEEVLRGLLQPVYVDGTLLTEVSLAEIRERVKAG